MTDRITGGAARPDNVRAARELPNGVMVWSWTGSDEELSLRTRLGAPLGLRRLGVNHDVLPPGRRSSLPHFERYEEECVYVLKGHPEVVIDGESHELHSDDFVAFAPGGPAEHTLVNRTDADVELIVIGERLDAGHDLVDRLAASWAEGGAQDLYAEACEYEDVGAGVRLSGAATTAAAVDERRAAFPDLAVAVSEVLVFGTKMSFEWTLTGTHEQPYRGKRASGKRLSWRGATVLEARRGRVVAQRDYTDTTLLHAPLGS